MKIKIDLNQAVILSLKSYYSKIIIQHGIKADLRMKNHA